jgi:Galactose oxidase, central domain
LNLDDEYMPLFEWRQQTSPTSSSHTSLKRWGYGATSNDKGGMVVFGGMDAQSSQYLRDLWYWSSSDKYGDNTEGKWIDLSASSPPYDMTTFPNAPSPRFGMLMATMRSGAILAIGGEAVKTSSRRRDEVTCLSDVYSLNLNKILSNLGSVTDDITLQDTWRRLEDMPGPCLTGMATEVVLIGSKEFVITFGGSHNGVKGETFTNNLWLFDVQANQWQLIGPPFGASEWPCPRDRHAMTFVKRLNSVFIFGGRTQSSPTTSGYDILDDLWTLDLTSHNWKQLHGSSFETLKQYQM